MDTQTFCTKKHTEGAHFPRNSLGTASNFEPPSPLLRSWRVEMAWKRIGRSQTFSGSLPFAYEVFWHFPLLVLKGHMFAFFRGLGQMGSCVFFGGAPFGWL